MYNNDKTINRFKIFRLPWLCLVTVVFNWEGWQFARKYFCHKIKPKVLLKQKALSSVENSCRFEITNVGHIDVSVSGKLKKSCERRL